MYKGYLGANTKADLVLEKRHARFMVDFLRPYKHTANIKFNAWYKEWKRLIELCKK